FLAEGPTVFGDISNLFDRQVGRLSRLEQFLLTWLAIEREPVDVRILAADLGPEVPRGELVEAVEALGRRSPLERAGDSSTRRRVVLGYASERRIQAVAAEIGAGVGTRLAGARLRTHALVKATAKDYVRRSQERLLVQPLLERLVRGDGSPEAAERRLQALRGEWRGRAGGGRGCGPGHGGDPPGLLRGGPQGEGHPRPGPVGGVAAGGGGA